MATRPASSCGRPTAGTPSGTSRSARRRPPPWPRGSATGCWWRPAGSTTTAWRPAHAPSAPGHGSREGSTPTRCSRRPPRRSLTPGTTPRATPRLWARGATTPPTTDALGSRHERAGHRRPGASYRPETAGDPGLGDPLRLPATASYPVGAAHLRPARRGPDRQGADAQGVRLAAGPGDRARDRAGRHRRERPVGVRRAEASAAPPREPGDAARRPGGDLTRDRGRGAGPRRTTPGLRRLPARGVLPGIGAPLAGAGADRRGLRGLR